MSIPTVSAAEFASQAFDYVIVGGGTAGLAVAARLSERPDITVGVIEAGAATLDAPAINAPWRFGEGIGTQHDWLQETAPQAGLRGRKVYWPRGKVLGGSSALNFMTWNRPCREDLDAWEALGNKGWGWEGLLPYYKKSESFAAPDATLQDRFRCFYDKEVMGTDGPVSVAYTKEHFASHQYWHPTLNTLGIETNRAHQAGSNVGVWTNMVSLDSKTMMHRAYSTTAYYIPNAGRKNLFLLADAATQEIMLEQDGNEWRATGVHFIHDSVEWTVKAAREVILSAGSISSPQLLELSGIGKPDVLAAAGIMVNVNNPSVGENLQDHTLVCTVYEIDPSIQTPDDLRADPILAAAADKEYLATQSGPRSILPCSFAYVPLSLFASKETLESIGMRSKHPGASRKDQIRTQRFTEVQRLGQAEFVLNIGNMVPSAPTVSGKKYITLVHISQYPFSEGSVHISLACKGSAKALTETTPIIDPNYYGGPAGILDLEVVEMSIEFGRNIARTAPMSKIIGKRIWPPEELEPSEASDDQRLKEWIRDNTGTSWHPIGTCAMGGSEGEKAGVVDDRLRVYGVKGLRVVDASIMPLMISAHLQATVYAIAEKASEMILQDAGML